MSDILLDAFKDSLHMLPFLLVIYVGIEWLEHRYGYLLQEKIRHAGHAGPLLGALFGSIPQCGFSVVGSALYTRRLITTGTLLAVFLSTSDEALPIILAQPNRLYLVLPLLLTKVVLALVAGYGIDLFTRRKRSAEETNEAHIGHQHHADEEEVVPVEACCGHHITTREKFLKQLWHPLRHTAQVFFFLFLVSVAIGMFIHYVAHGEENLGALLQRGSLWQPVITAFVGLIPNCAASVAITQVFLDGGISFGAAISGLSASAGLGMLVLVKENGRLRDTLRIVGLLLAVSIASGILIQACWK